MTKRGRRTRKDDDEVLMDITEATGSAVGFFEKYQNFILGVLGGIILLAAAYLAYKYLYKAPMEEEASEALYQAQLQFEKDSFALALSNPNPTSEGFLDIAENYSGTKAGNTAKYYAGISYLNLGQFDDAISYLEDFRPRGEITPIMTYGALGDAYSETGDFDRSMKEYRKAGAYENNFLAPYYLYKLALLQKKQGDNSAALETLNKIAKEYPESSNIADVEKYIALLSGE